MKISKFISDIITNYEQNHKPLNIDILMRLIYEANNKVKICYNNNPAELSFLTIFDNAVILYINTNVNHKKIFPVKSQYILYLIKTDRHDELNITINYEIINNNNNIFFSQITNNYFAWTDIENRQAAVFFIENNIVKYYLQFDSVNRFSCYNESNNFIIEKFKKDIPDIINNMIAWNILEDLKK
jgi:hypothetical protein